MKELLLINIFLVFVLMGLMIALDSKVWAKMDRLVNLIILERTEIVKKIESLLTRIELLETKLQERDGETR